jgi:hypothetical protein
MGSSGSRCASRLCGREAGKGQIATESRATAACATRPPSGRRMPAPVCTTCCETGTPRSLADKRRQLSGLAGRNEALKAPSQLTFIAGM